MKLSELMAGKTPSKSYKGDVVANNFVLAVDCTEEGNAASPAEYAVVQINIAGVDAQLNPETTDKAYIRSGKSTIKTGTQRSFSVSGDRYVGDEFQDFVLGLNIIYGVGQAVRRPYVFFNMLTGEGEQGEVSIIVNSDGGGNAEDSAEIDIELKKIGDTPVAYSWAAE